MQGQHMANPHPYIFLTLQLDSHGSLLKRTTSSPTFILAVHGCSQLKEQESTDFSRKFCMLLPQPSTVVHAYTQTPLGGHAFTC